MIVVDASVIVDALVLQEPGLRKRLSVERLHAPTLIDYEVLSALRGLTLGGHLSTARGVDALADFATIPLTRHPASRALQQAAWALRDRLTAYDASYAVLAAAMGAPLWTRDARFAKAASASVEVRVL